MKEFEKLQKHKAKKLRLDRETLYTLDSSELGRVVGGGPDVSAVYAMGGGSLSTFTTDPT